MSIDAILDASRAGLTHERQRLDAASRNIAAANVPLAPGQTATQWLIGTASPSFASLVSGSSTLTQQSAEVRTVHDPGHPLADDKGEVRYPATDLVQEMTTLVTASRGYEANVRAFNILRGMLLRALEIGAK